MKNFAWKLSHCEPCNVSSRTSLLSRFNLITFYDGEHDIYEMAEKIERQFNFETFFYNDFFCGVWTKISAFILNFVFIWTTFGTHFQLMCSILWPQPYQFAIRILSYIFIILKNRKLRYVIGMNLENTHFYLTYKI